MAKIPVCLIHHYDHYPRSKVLYNVFIRNNPSIVDWLETNLPGYEYRFERADRARTGHFASIIFVQHDNEDLLVTLKLTGLIKYTPL